ncbi:MAG: hypothetical protein VR77_11505 [Flavobacteriales bacterium BRH_c54]|nr:MAG: hypothetical protein VR77_11505 [Flavobacteriales bacterium BRH_c54]
MSKKYKNHNKKTNINKVEKENKKNLFSDKPILLIGIKSLFMILLFFFAILYIDTKGYFNPNEKNNHTKKKWDSFYEFTKKNNVDILLMGNSHLYSGINPKNLSITLGVNSFILASPGTNIADSYYGLKEALKRTDAKLVVIETYGINDFNPYELKDGNLSDQLKSFYARKDILSKLTSMPFLFKSDNYFYAWSNTLRNHGFIFNDTTQLALNKKLIKNKSKEKKKLYLGRFVRFQKGLENQTLAKYDSLGSPVKGADYSYSSYAEKYVKKIVDLCEKEKIELVFLTLPMYEKHVSEYYKWEKKLAEILKQYPNKWINMQKVPGYNGFGPYAFENTYKSNQHMTYNGSLLATYKLANYIRDSLNVELPLRHTDNKWHKLFYGEEGYFENFNPYENDINNRIICTNKKLQNITIKNCLLLDINNTKANKIIVKIDKKMFRGINYENVKLRLLLKFDYNGVKQTASIDLNYDMFHQLEKEVIFTSLIKPLRIENVIDGAIIGV